MSNKKQDANPVPWEQGSTPETTVLDGYLTKPQLAQQLRQSPRTLDRWETLRIGPPRILIGRTVLFRREAVLAWLEAREQRRGRR
jgi:hypothetical protein